MLKKMCWMSPLFLKIYTNRMVCEIHIFYLVSITEIIFWVNECLRAAADAELAAEFTKTLQYSVREFGRVCRGRNFGVNVEKSIFIVV